MVIVLQHAFEQASGNIETLTFIHKYSMIRTSTDDLPIRTNTPRHTFKPFKMSSSCIIPTFFEWAQDHWTKNIRPDRVTNPMNSDQLLELDISTYTEFLAELKRDASAKLNIFVTTQMEAQAHGDHLTRLSYVNSTYDDFIAKQREIRERHFDWCPSSFQRTVAPTFLEFCSSDSLLAREARDGSRSRLYTFYAHSILLDVTRETWRKFELTRECIAEGDRRELYGFPRKPNTTGLEHLHERRRQFRSLLRQVERLPPVPFGHILEELVLEGIAKLRSRIAVEKPLPKDQDDVAMEMLWEIRDQMYREEEVPLYGNNLRSYFRETTRAEKERLSNYLANSGIEHRRAMLASEDPTTPRC